MVHSCFLGEAGQAWIPGDPHHPGRDTVQGWERGGGGEGVVHVQCQLFIALGRDVSHETGLF